MANPKLSVIVPTRDRPARLRATLQALSSQRDIDSGDYELIVVDDGSVPPVEAEPASGGAQLIVERLEGDERSAARNRGAVVARGKLLVFVDDDMLVAPDFLSKHWEAHLRWPEGLQIGSTGLPDAALRTPFGRFRYRLEAEVVPADAGPVDLHDFVATAQNMGIDRGVFKELGGFDPQLSVAEDLDLALRHAGSGRTIVFVPAAISVHDDDDALDLHSYCRRAERYMQELVRFGERHPDWPDTLERERVNGPVRWVEEPATLSAKKLLKSALLWPPFHGVAVVLVSFLERIRPDSPILDRLYRGLLGAHLQRGYRRGLRSSDA